MFLTLQWARVEELHWRFRTIDIRNHPKTAFQQRSQADERWLKYKECTILEGDFTISMVFLFCTLINYFLLDYPTKRHGQWFSRIWKAAWNYWGYSSFPNKVGIIFSNFFCCLYIFRGLKSLGRMFPSLRVIGGHSLIMNYALVIYQNSDLMDIGFVFFFEFILTRVFQPHKIDGNQEWWNSYHGKSEF